MKKRDFIFIAVIFLLSGIFFITAKLTKKYDTVYIYKDSELYGTYSLSEPQMIDISGTNTLVIENKSVYMKDATCPDKLCVHQGILKGGNGAIVCLPNKVVVSLSGSKTDTISR